MKNKFFTVYIEQDENGIFIGSIPTVSSCYAEGKTQEKMLKNLQEILKLCLRNVDSSKKLGQNRFVGVQNLEMSYA